MADFSTQEKPESNEQTIIKEKKRWFTYSDDSLLRELLKEKKQGNLISGRKKLNPEGRVKM